MEKTLFIHLGPVKTGSTAIQRFLSINDKLLLENGFHYIKTLRWGDGSHSPLAWILHHKYSMQHLNMYSIPYVTNQDAYITDLATEIDSSRDMSIIMSSEIFPLLSSDALGDILDLFPKMPVKVIFYIRDFREQALSLAAQIVRFQDSYTTDDRLSVMYNNHILYFHNYYLRCLHLWEDKIGNENLIFRKYGSEYFKGGNIYADVLDAMGLKFSSAFALPDRLQKESLIYCESIYVKDLLNRLILKTPQETLEEHLLAWEKVNEGTKFYLPHDISIKIEEDASRIHNYLLENYLDASYASFFNKPMPLRETEYKLSYSDFEHIIRYLDVNIANFKDEFMEAMLMAFDRTYEYELKLREFEFILESAIQSQKGVALWGCGDITRRLFGKHAFLKYLPLFIVDTNTEKQGSYFMGHQIMPPSAITDKNMDTVIIASIKYADEIEEEINHKYPCVKNVIRLCDLLVASN